MDLPENADKQLILDNFKNGMAWAMMLIKEDKQQIMADKENITTNEDKANEQKAKEICHCSECTYKIKSEGDNCMCPRMAAILQAMEWKDKQFAQEKQQLIDDACKWLLIHDSYAKPTNLQVDRLREYLNNKLKGE